MQQKLSFQAFFACCTSRTKVTLLREISSLNHGAAWMTLHYVRQTNRILMRSLSRSAMISSLLTLG